MTKGRKPIPSKLKVVAGTERPHRRNDFEPRPEISMPTCPDHLNDFAKEEWSRVCQEAFDTGILTKLDRAALGAYCQAYGRMVQAENILLEMAKTDPLYLGLMVQTTNGNWVQNPVVGTANKAMQDMVRYAVEFGFTPSARSRVQAGEVKKENPFAIIDAM
ncbi:MAG: phage terminase small subunit P27 family [Ahrensia sp.]|nr:phage terminase small subunit P27 family [Ahrensia sp.]